MSVLNDFQQRISVSIPDVELRYNEPMSKHTSFRIGGPVEVMAFPKNKEELAALANLVIAQTTFFIDSCASAFSNSTRITPCSPISRPYILMTFAWTRIGAGSVSAVRFTRRQSRSRGRADATISP